MRVIGFRSNAFGHTKQTSKETAFSSEVLMVANPGGRLSLEQVCRNLEEELIAPLLLHHEASQAKEYQVNEEKLQGS